MSEPKPRQTTFRLPVDVDDKLKRFSEASGFSQGEIILMGLKRQLEKMEEFVKKSSIINRDAKWEDYR